MEKTNVMRILSAEKIEYTAHTYDPSVTDGMTIAQTLGEDPLAVFKTLVTEANTGEHFVFVVPVCASLDLKKAAKAVGVKSIAMIPQRELRPITGYIHGGCSPIGMKKKFTTVIDEICRLSDTIFCSAGQVGWQIELSPEALIRFCDAKISDITKE